MIASGFVGDRFRRRGRSLRPRRERRARRRGFIAGSIRIELRAEAGRDQAAREGAAHVADADDDDRALASPWSFGSVLVLGASLALIDHRCRRFGSRLTGPDHELEGRIVAVAGFERSVDQAFALLGRRADGAAQQQAVAVDHLAAVGLHLEMAEPELLVDDVDQRRDFGALQLRHLDFELRGELQRLDIVAPAERQMMIFGLAGEGEVHLILAGAVEQPFVLNCDLLHQIDGIALRHFGLDLRWCSSARAAFLWPPESARRRRGPAAVHARANQQGYAGRCSGPGNVRSTSSRPTRSTSHELKRAPKVESRARVRLWA